MCLLDERGHPEDKASCLYPSVGPSEGNQKPTELQGEICPRSSGRASVEDPGLLTSGLSCHATLGTRCCGQLAASLLSWQRCRLQEVKQRRACSAGAPDLSATAALSLSPEDLDNSLTLSIRLMTGCVYDRQTRTCV